MVLAAGCSFEKQKTKVRPQPSAAQAITPAAGTYVLGSSITPAGAVPKDAAGEMFVRGGPLYLSIDVNGATHAKEIAVEWIDPHGRVFRRDARAVPETAAYAAFTPGATSSLLPGNYRVAVIIDGRRVTEQVFTMA